MDRRPPGIVINSLGRDGQSSRGRHADRQGPPCEPHLVRLSGPRPRGAGVQRALGFIPARVLAPASFLPAWRRWHQPRADGGIAEAAAVLRIIPAGARAAGCVISCSVAPSRRRSAAVLACALRGVMLGRSEARVLGCSAQQRAADMYRMADSTGHRRSAAHAREIPGQSLRKLARSRRRAEGRESLGEQGAGSALPPEATCLVIRAAAPAPRRIHTGPRTIVHGSEDPTVSAPHSALTTNM